MKFHKRLIKTIHDIENENSLLIHTLAGCNLNCYYCHNKEDLLTEDYYSIENIIEIIKHNGYFFDNIIISGGEPTLYGGSLGEFITTLKNIFNGKIILYTNGTNPSVLNEIINILDGVYVDIKYNIFSEEDSFNILGNTHNKEDIMESLNIVYKNNNGFSGFRTVKYPQFNDSYLNKLFIKVKELFPLINYRQNEFSFNN